jgi:hypothetical protein
MSNASRNAYRERGRVLKHARELARSGQYPDCASIIEHLEPLDTRSRDALQSVKRQLDSLCALAGDKLTLRAQWRAQSADAELRASA